MVVWLNSVDWDEVGRRLREAGNWGPGIFELKGVAIDSQGSKMVDKLPVTVPSITQVSRIIFRSACIPKDDFFELAFLDWTMVADCGSSLEFESTMTGGPPNGVFPYAAVVSMAGITDGTSNTIAFGEWKIGDGKAE